MRFRAAVTYLAAVIIVTAHARSLGTGSVGTSDTNVTKRETRDDPFPDWVPFKNKHGEELGEFLQVETVTKKPKKRLALPMNFVLKAVADPEPEEYYEKGLESDNGDYSEKGDWSDASRLSSNAGNSLPIKHTELSDIDGVVGIITRDNAIGEIQTREGKSLSEKSTPVQNEDYSDYKDESEKRKSAPSSNEPTENKNKKSLEKKSEDYSDDEDEVEKSKADVVRKEQTENHSNKLKAKDSDDYSDNDSDTDKRKSEITSEERVENERKKALILDSVDKLKERHANEQKLISEKIKEEALHAEERDRSYVGREQYNEYNQKPRVRPLDFDDYDGKYEDKYKLSPSKKSTSNTKATSTPSESTSPKISRTGKMSVFRNPSIYMIYDEETTTDSTTTPITKKISSVIPDTTTTHHSKLTAPMKKVDSDERISLVPQDNELRGEEPTLFFPRKTKRRNPRRRTKGKDIDSQVSATTQEKAKDTTPTPLSTLSDAKWTSSGPEALTSSGTGTGTDFTPLSSSEREEKNASSSVESEVATSSTGAETIQTSKEVTGPGETAASAPEQVVEALVSPADTVPASSDHEEDHKGEHHYESEKGGEREHHSEHHSEHGESGKKAYEGHHEDKKTAKGHHDKEDHVGKYDDQGGSKKEHHNEQKHYGAHHHEEHGKKHAEYEESGKHSKGHSTKGSHDIHKKEEYEKKVEFFEEEGDSAEEEKHGGHTEETGHKKGGKFGKGHLDSGHHHRVKGDSGHFDKGGHHAVQQGHSGSGGHNSHGKHVGSKFNEGGQKSGKKWIFHHGSPATNANLVVIDRRGDQFYHGPQYYG